MHDAALGTVRLRAAQFVKRDILARHCLDNARSRDEHVRVLLRQNDEIGQSGRINRAARARSQYQRDLRHDARCQRIALEYLPIADQTARSLLNARPARIVDADDGDADAHRGVHHLAYLHRMCFGERAAQDCEILRENSYPMPVDAPHSRDDAVAQIFMLIQAKRIDAVRHKRADLLKTPRVQ